MQLIGAQNRIMDKNKVIDCLRKENQFISYLLLAFEVPEKKEDDEKLNAYLLDNDSKDKGPFMKPAKKPAETPEELQDRMDVMKNKITVKHLQRKAKKPVDTKIDRKKLKKEKDFKKKLHRITKDAQRNEKLKQERANTVEKKNVDKQDNKDLQQKPIFNVDSKIVFSKIDFAESEKKKKGLDTNPKNLLAKIKKQKEDLKELKESGDHEKYAKVKNEMAWKKAFDKTLGNKIRDDPQLLLKKIKKRKKEKVKAKKTWKDRTQKVEHDKQARQKKRNENLKKRVDDKKKKKMKKLESRGRIIPGF